MPQLANVKQNLHLACVDDFNSEVALELNLNEASEAARVDRIPEYIA